MTVPEVRRPGTEGQVHVLEVPPSTSGRAGFTAGAGLQRPSSLTPTLCCLQFPPLIRTEISGLGAVHVPVLQMRRWRRWESPHCAQGHTAGQQWGELGVGAQRLDSAITFRTSHGPVPGGTRRMEAQQARACPAALRDPCGGSGTGQCVSTCQRAEPQTGRCRGSGAVQVEASGAAERHVRGGTRQKMLPERAGVRKAG